MDASGHSNLTSSIQLRRKRVSYDLHITIRYLLKIQSSTACFSWPLVNFVPSIVRSPQVPGDTQPPCVLLLVTTIINTKLFIQLLSIKSVLTFKQNIPKAGCAWTLCTAVLLKTTFAESIPVVRAKLNTSYTLS